MGRALGRMQGERALAYEAFAHLAGSLARKRDAAYLLGLHSALQHLPCSTAAKAQASAAGAGARRCLGRREARIVWACQECCSSREDAGFAGAGASKDTDGVVCVGSHNGQLLGVQSLRRPRTSVSAFSVFASSA